MILMKLWLTQTAMKSSGADRLLLITTLFERPELGPNLGMSVNVSP